MKFLAIKKWKDGRESTMEYFKTLKDALAWIDKQPKPRDDSFKWYVGEY